MLQNTHCTQTRTVHGLVINRGLFRNKEVYQEEPKEEPVSDIALPNSTSLVHSIAGGGGVVTAQKAQSIYKKVVKLVIKEMGFADVGMVTPEYSSTTTLSDLATSAKTNKLPEHMCCGQLSLATNANSPRSIDRGLFLGRNDRGMSRRTKGGTSQRYCAPQLNIAMTLG